MHRLETLASEFARRLEQLSAEEQRAIASTACELALSRNSVQHAAVDAGEAALRSGNPIAAAERERIRELVDALDDEYLDLQEAAEEQQTQAAEWELAFRRARAVASLYWALDDDPLLAASEAVYEAAAAVTDPAEVLAAVELSFQH